MLLERHASSRSPERVTQDQGGQGPAIEMNSGIRSIGDRDPYDRQAPARLITSPLPINLFGFGDRRNRTSTSIRRGSSISPPELGKKDLLTALEG